MELTLWVMISFSQSKEKGKKAPGSCRWKLAHLQLSRGGHPHYRLLAFFCCVFLEQHGKEGHPARTLCPGMLPSGKLTAPSWSNPCAWNLPTLWVIQGAWGLLSTGKLPAASLPGSFRGWDPSESYCGGEGRGEVRGTSGAQAEQGRGQEGGFWMELQGL